MVKLFCLVLVLALTLPACSRFSESARGQRAYEKYVRKSSVIRTRQQSRFLRGRAPQMPRTEAGPATETTTQESPQSVPKEQGDQ
jgi:hypothetical protein